jgi:hypothetical protein
VPKLKDIFGLYDFEEGSALKGEVHVKKYVTKILEYLHRDSRGSVSLKLSNEHRLEYDNFALRVPDIMLMHKR